MTSTSNYEHLILALESNYNSTKYISGVSILLRILDNIVNEPHNVKYRTIRLENKVVKEKLLPLHGVIELLNSIGFIEADGTLNLPAGALVDNVKRIRDQLKERLEFLQTNTPEPSTSQSSGSNVMKKHPTTIIPLRSFAARIDYPRVVPFANAFLQHLEDRSDQVLQYEDERLQYHGRQIVPVKVLTENTLKHMRKAQKQQAANPQKERDPDFDDLFLVELTHWFNKSFFEWVSMVPCKVCNDSTKGRRVSSIEQGLRVEILTCCNTQTKFLRYNDISQLLLTRKGRCGEYANCFTFLCRSLGYEARLVYATFDHVWSEVYSEAQKRWIHIDPSDDVIDAPLMYQHGWKRKIDYIIAYSNEDIQDVTWRYTNKHAEIKRNRNNCTEPELLKTILLLRGKRQKDLSTARKRFLTKRTLGEVIQSMVERDPTDDELKGRTSGSLSWRAARGEKQTNNFYTFNATEAETAQKQLNVRYSSATDTYQRYIKTSNGQIEVTESTKDWQSSVHSSEDIFRKEESDWKMVYLARMEDAVTAQIIWAFDFSKSNLKIKDVKLTFNTMTYEDGNVDVEFSYKGKPLPSIEHVIDLDSFSLCARLSGGKGDCAWQHTQLFRQSTSSSNEYPFSIEIIFH